MYKREEILPLLRSTGYQQLSEILRQVDEVELFFGLYAIAAQAAYLKQHQNTHWPCLVAGNLLLELNPTCQISCKEAVKTLLDEWDISLEEVPFYIYKQFGIGAIREAIDQLHTEPLLQGQLVRLDTVKYWAEIAEKEGIESIEKTLERNRSDLSRPQQSRNL